MSTLKIRRLATSGASAFAVFALSASAAPAGSSEVISGERGHVRFDDHGEILTAYAGPYAGGAGVRA